MLATPQEAAREQARNEGRDHPEAAWICTFFDTWEPNPFYVGPPVRHPDDDWDEEMQLLEDCGQDDGEAGASYCDDIPF